MDGTPRDIVAGYGATAFETVNGLAASADVIAFLDATEALPFTRDCKQRMRACAAPKPGQHVLDLGCGLGHEARRLQALVGARGRVVGLDANADAIDEARRRAGAAPIEFLCGNALRLPFPDASFDLVRADRVAEYVAVPQLMLAEMVRVLRPGGRLVVVDFDYDRLVVDVADRALGARVRAVVAAAVPNPGVGGQLREHFVRLGLHDVGCEPLTMSLTPALYRELAEDALRTAVTRGELGAADGDAWWRALADAEREDRFFARLGGVIGCGTRSDS